jgi:tRNA-(ms[2]io[6]A)-hydroxylase
MAMSFVAKYPDRKKIIPKLITTAVEELRHFQQVHKLMEKKGVALNGEMKEDLYIKQLVQFCRTGRSERFLDRLLMAAVVECRGAERFFLVHDALQDEKLKQFYLKLHESERNHGNIFVDMARIYFAEDEIQKRLKEFVTEESRIIEGLELRAALH